MKGTFFFISDIDFIVSKIYSVLALRFSVIPIISHISEVYKGVNHLTDAKNKMIYEQVKINIEYQTSDKLIKYQRVGTIFGREVRLYD